MIRAYSRSDTNPTHNGNILHPLSATVSEEANGTFELEMDLPKTDTVSRGDLILAPTPRGNQYFRVYKPIRTLSGWKVYAFHKFYDLAKNFLIDVRPEGETCGQALQTIMDGCETTPGFTVSSDISTVNTAYYIRLSPVEAIMSADNSILNLWGGCLIRDNDTITINSSGNDKGYEVRLGKNLTGIEDNSDESGVVTRLYPTVVLGDANTVYALPEKYVDSPLLEYYGAPIIRETRIELTDEQKALDITEIYEIMRGYCNDLFDINGIDKPTVNYKVDFVELSKTAEYQNVYGALLEQLDLYDIVSIKIAELDISVKASVIKYKYDCLKERYETIEIGEFDYSSNYSASQIANNLQKTVEKKVSTLEYMTNVITGNLGGYVITRKYPNGKPYEFLVMDTDDISTAQNVIRINKEGIGISKSGYNGPFEIAMTIDGHFSANFIDTGAMTADRIRAGILQSLSGGLKINLNEDNMVIDDVNSTTRSILDDAGFEVQDKTGSTNARLFFAGVENGRADVQTQFIDVEKYIKIGTNSRVEDYGTGRTGVFYVGG